MYIYISFFYILIKNVYNIREKIKDEDEGEGYIVYLFQDHVTKKSGPLNYFILA